MAKWFEQENGGKINVQYPSIGTTEQGDAGRHFKAVNAAISKNEHDAYKLLTKCITDGLIDVILTHHSQGKRIILSCGLTGWGGTPVEPNNPKPEIQAAQLKKLIGAGFPAEQVVWRCDPIDPGSEGLCRGYASIRLALDTFGSDVPFRFVVSVMDDYPHTKRRYVAHGLPQVYEGDRKFANDEEFADVARMLASFPKITFRTCAEPLLIGKNIIRQGCISDEDLNILGITRTGSMRTNGQGRAGCKCLRAKSEMLAFKCQCPAKCLYCYWWG